jgi:hypothetical protein
MMVTMEVLAHEETHATDSHDTGGEQDDSKPMLLAGGQIHTILTPDSSYDDIRSHRGDARL